ncbi:MAG: DegV family protein, partial [Butyricicoccus sp.]|nr:DegV family protein [Butyricicoccus sp.]
DRFEDIVRVTKARVRRSEAIIGVYTLRHLKKSGRISGASAFVGEALGLKPIMHACDGAVNVVEKARGEKNLIPKVMDQVKKRVVRPETQIAYLAHASLPAQKLDEIEAAIRAIGFADVKRSTIGVSVTSNLGPASFAVMYYGEQRPVD